MNIDAILEKMTLKEKIALCSGGIKGGLMKGLLHLANGRYFQGVKTMIIGK